MKYNEVVKIYVKEENQDSEVVRNAQIIDKIDAPNGNVDNEENTESLLHTNSQREVSNKDADPANAEKEKLKEEIVDKNAKREASHNDADLAKDKANAETNALEKEKLLDEKIKALRLKNAKREASHRRVDVDRVV